MGQRGTHTCKGVLADVGESRSPLDSLPVRQESCHDPVSEVSRWRHASRHRFAHLRTLLLQDGAVSRTDVLLDLSPSSLNGRDKADQFRQSKSADMAAELLSDVRGTRPSASAGRRVLETGGS